MNQKFFFLFLVATIFISASATSVIAGTVTEGTLITNLTQEGNVKYRVILPASYSKTMKYPVLYLLHSYGTNFDWWQSESKVHELIDSSHTFIAVSVGDGRSDKDCWWLDSPLNTKSQWAKFITTVLKPKIDKTFSTYADRANTGIMGFSMGGFGALHILAKRPDLFGVALSVNGGVCPSHFADQYGIKKLLGDPDAQKNNYTAVNIIDNIAQYKKSNYPCIIRFYNNVYDDEQFSLDNNSLDVAMCAQAIPHDHYIYKNSESLDVMKIGEGHKYPSKADMEVAMKFFDKSFLNGNASLKNQYDPNDYSTMLRRTIENRNYMQIESTETQLH
jgi:S-formylglutathione hydrolase FrmB